MVSEIIAGVIIVLALIATFFVFKIANKEHKSTSKVVGLNVVEKDVEYDNRFFVYKVYENKEEVLLTENPITIEQLENLFIQWGKGEIS